MKTLVQSGETIEFVNAGADIAAGDVVPVGEKFGVAMVDIAGGASGSVMMGGAHELAKDGGALTQGQKVFWDTVAKNVTGTASADAQRVMGHVIAAAAGGDAKAIVKLDPIAKQAATQADSVAADVATLKADFNALLAKLKAAGLMAAS